MPGLGHRSYIQFGLKETTYGTFQIPAGPGYKQEVISWDVEPNIAVIQDPSLYAQPSRRAIYQGPYNVKGTFKVRLNYEGLLELFRAAFGTYANTLVETGVRDHKFSEASLLNSYSFEVAIGDVTAGKVFRLLGAKIVALKVSGKAGTGDDAMLMAEFTVLGKDYVSNQTPTGSLNFPPVFPVLFHQGITMDDGTADAASSVRIRSFEVTYENPHTEDRFYLGSLTMDEPLRQDFLVARWRLEQEFTTLTQWDAARAFTLMTPQLIFQHPTTIGVSSKREFELRSNKAQVTDFGAPVQGYGVVISTITMEAYQDPTDVSALFARFRNTEAALT
jgi:hypothetical protein